jgi:energy-coupling factor transporter ATP-binding protein EcfA2
VSGHQGQSPIPELTIYDLYNTSIAADFSIPELASRDEGSASIHIFHSSVETPPVDCEWVFHWYSDDEQSHLAASLGIERGFFRLRYPEVGDYLIDEDLSIVRCEPQQGAEDTAVRHYLIDHVIPRVMAQRGSLILHASAVQLSNGRGVAFLGRSGAGKSTLAAAFASRGHQHVADDGLLLTIEAGRLYGIPSYAGARVLPDTAEQFGLNELGKVKCSTGKQRLQFDGKLSESKFEVSDIYILDSHDAEEDSEHISAKELKGAEAVISLIRRSFQLHVNDQASTSTLFSNALDAIACPVRIFELAYPREFEAIGAVIGYVEDRA